MRISTLLRYLAQVLYLAFLSSSAQASPQATVSFDCTEGDPQTFELPLPSEYLAVIGAIKTNNYYMEVELSSSEDIANNQLFLPRNVRQDVASENLDASFEVDPAIHGVDNEFFTMRGRVSFDQNPATRYAPLEINLVPSSPCLSFADPTGFSIQIKLIRADDLETLPPLRVWVAFSNTNEINDFHIDVPTSQEIITNFFDLVDFFNPSLEVWRAANFGTCDNGASCTYEFYQYHLSKLIYLHHIAGIYTDTYSSSTLFDGLFETVNFTLSDSGEVFIELERDTLVFRFCTTAGSRTLKIC